MTQSIPNQEELDRQDLAINELITQLRLYPQIAAKLRWHLFNESRDPAKVTEDVSAYAEVAITVWNITLINLRHDTVRFTGIKASTVEEAILLAKRELSYPLSWSHGIKDGKLL